LRKLIIVATLLLAGCSESSSNSYDDGYVDGYNSALYDMCKLLESEFPSVKDEIQQCRRR